MLSKPISTGLKDAEVTGSDKKMEKMNLDPCGGESFSAGYSLHREGIGDYPKLAHP
jgi:hypothetical protein